MLPAILPLAPGHSSTQRAAAILDRLLHHAITANMRSNSYRLKEKMKAGLVKPTEALT